MTSNKISSLQLLLLPLLPQQKFAHFTNFIEFEYLTFKAFIVSYSVGEKKPNRGATKKFFIFVIIFMKFSYSYNFTGNEKYRIKSDVKLNDKAAAQRKTSMQCCH